MKGLDYQKTPVILENINVFSATILTKPIRLDVIITPGHGDFEILDGDQVAASGRITIPDENRPFYYSDLNAIETSKIAERIEVSKARFNIKLKAFIFILLISMNLKLFIYHEKISDELHYRTNEKIKLDTEDAYKEFLLRGYEYGQAFRGAR